jgi:ribosome-associated toxin RatA of RatAB toxin-antitoxin module
VPVVNKSALVKYSAQSMFELVDDIESYPEFLPWCSGSAVLVRKHDFVEATVNVSRSGFKSSFTTRNQLNNPINIKMVLIDGPFSHLEGDWDFTALREDASKISLNLDFEVSSTIASMAFGGIFNQICNTMVSSFTARAKQIYG